MKDLFGQKQYDKALNCDTGQPGCAIICKNRFAPLTHTQLWNLELLFWMFSTGIFAFICNMLDSVDKTYKAVKDDPDKVATFKRQNMGMSYSLAVSNEKAAESKVYGKKPVVQFAYALMLICRLLSEGWFLYLEKELNRNQSQNANFYETMQLKEKWYCYSNYDGNVYDDKYAPDFYMPEANRSSFWTDAPAPACQQQDRVTCWVQFSRIKSYGLQFMYLMLVVNFCLSALELCWLAAHVCCFNRNKKED